MLGAPCLAGVGMHGQSGNTTLPWRCTLCCQGRNDTGKHVPTSGRTQHRIRVRANHLNSGGRFDHRRGSLENDHDTPAHRGSSGNTNRIPAHRLGGQASQPCHLSEVWSKHESHHATPNSCS